MGTTHRSHEKIYYTKIAQGRKCDHNNINRRYWCENCMTSSVQCCKHTFSYLQNGKLGTTFPIWLTQISIPADWEPHSQFDLRRSAFLQIGNHFPNLRLCKLGKLQIGKKFPNLQENVAFPICNDVPNLFLQIGNNFPNLLQIGKIWSPVFKVLDRGMWSWFF